MVCYAAAHHNLTIKLIKKPELDLWGFGEQAKAASDRQTKKHVSLQRRRPQEQARTEPAAKRNEENQRGDRTPSRERCVRPGGQEARRPDGRAPRRDRHGSTPTPTEDEASGNEDDEPRAPGPRAKKAKKAKNR